MALQQELGLLPERWLGPAPDHRSNFIADAVDGSLNPAVQDLPLRAPWRIAVA